ncbi:MAG: pyridoxal-phosphate dependent enzyme, partial [Chloroflexi bacterium]
MKLERIVRPLNGRIVAKLEYLNPGFSKKDRIARQIIEDAIASGQLQPGQTVVELTSGNTGTGLAIVCAVFGHQFVAVMSEGGTPCRRLPVHQRLGCHRHGAPAGPRGGRVCRLFIWRRGRCSNEAAGGRGGRADRGCRAGRLRSQVP